MRSPPEMFTGLFKTLIKHSTDMALSVLMSEGMYKLTKPHLVNLICFIPLELLETIVRTRDN